MVRGGWFDIIGPLILLNINIRQLLLMSVLAHRPTLRLVHEPYYISDFTFADTGAYIS
jgi:hypothetical protein